MNADTTCKDIHLYIQAIPGLCLSIMHGLTKLTAEPCAGLLMTAMSVSGLNRVVRGPDIIFSLQYYDIAHAMACSGLFEECRMCGYMLVMLCFR